jgi:hypothetical protein
MHVANAFAVFVQPDASTPRALQQLNNVEISVAHGLALSMLAGRILTGCFSLSMVLILGGELKVEKVWWLIEKRTAGVMEADEW